MGVTGTGAQLNLGWFLELKALTAPPKVTLEVSALCVQKYLGKGLSGLFPLVPTLPNPPPAQVCQRDLGFRCSFCVCTGLSPDPKTSGGHK